MPTNYRALAASSYESDSSFGFSFKGMVVIAAAVVRVLAGSSRQTLGQLFESVQLHRTQLLAHWLSKLGSSLSGSHSHSVADYSFGTLLPSGSSVCCFGHSVYSYSLYLLCCL